MLSPGRSAASPVPRTARLTKLRSYQKRNVRDATDTGKARFIGDHAKISARNSRGRKPRPGRIPRLLGRFGEVICDCKLFFVALCVLQRNGELEMVNCSAPNLSSSDCFKFLRIFRPHNLCKIGVPEVTSSESERTKA
jgi:hypothetical protein